MMQDEFYSESSTVKSQRSVAEPTFKVDCVAKNPFSQTLYLAFFTSQSCSYSVVAISIADGGAQAVHD